jgi:hypothetical protein
MSAGVWVLICIVAIAMIGLIIAVCHNDVVKEHFTSPLDPEPEPAKPAEKIDLVREWRAIKTAWRMIEQCHCGQTGQELKNNKTDNVAPSYGMVCPKCGHRNQWEVFVGREEYDYEILREPETNHENWHAVQEFLHAHHYEKDYPRNRNHKVIRWTGDVCDIPKANPEP